MNEQYHSWMTVQHIVNRVNISGRTLSHPLSRLHVSSLRPHRRSGEYRQRHRRHPLLALLPLQQPALRVHRAGGRRQHRGGGGKADGEPVRVRPVHHDSAHFAHKRAITSVRFTKQSGLSVGEYLHLTRLSVSFSGAGAPHGLRAAGGPGGEPLLVGGDVAHGLLVLTRHSPLPAEFHLQAQDAAVQPGGGDRRAGLRRRRHDHARSPTPERCLWGSPCWWRHRKTTLVIQIHAHGTVCYQCYHYFFPPPVVPFVPLQGLIETHSWLSEPGRAFSLFICVVCTQLCTLRVTVLD